MVSNKVLVWYGFYLNFSIHCDTFTLVLLLVEITSNSSHRYLSLKYYSAMYLKVKDHNENLQLKHKITGICI